MMMIVIIVISIIITYIIIIIVVVFYIIFVRLHEAESDPLCQLMLTGCVCVHIQSQFSPSKKSV